MGNESSTDLGSNFKEDVRGRSVETIAYKILHTNTFDNEVKLKKLAKLIFTAANEQENDRRMTIKFARLAKLLGGMTVPDSKNKNIFLTFKGVFLGIVGDHLIAFADRFSDEYRTINIMLLAELFIIEECSAARMLLWFGVLDGFTKSRKELLSLIRKKVELEVKKRNHEPDIDALNEMLNQPQTSRRSSQNSTPVRKPAPAVMESMSIDEFEAGPSTPRTQPRQPVPSVSVQPYMNASAPSEDDLPPPYAMYAPAFNYNAGGENASASGFSLDYGWAVPSRAESISSFESLPDLFDKFLVDLKENQSAPFDLERFEACSEDDRKKCANMLLDAFIADSKVAEPLARLLQTIQCTHPPEDVDHMAFSDHLSVLIESKIDQLVKETSKWKPLENIGNFLALSYSLDCITNVTMKKWFDAIQPSVASNNVKGTNVYVSVLELSLESMQIKNPTKFKFHVLQLQNLQPTVWLAPELQEWKKNFLSFHLEDVLSVSANKTQAKGAVRKISTFSRGLSTNWDEENPFVTLQSVLNSLNSEEDLDQALEGIVALKIEATSRNLRRITNMMTAKVAGHPDVMEIFTKVLEKLPEQSDPAFDKSEIKDPLKLSILDHLFSLQKDAKFPKDRFKNLTDFLKLLEDKELVDSGTIVEIIESLAFAARPEDKKILVTVLVKLLDTFGAGLMAQGLALNETSATLESHRNSKSQELRKLVGKGLQLLSQADGEAGQQEDLECLATKNFTSGRVENKDRFFEFLLELPTKSFEDTKLMLSKVKSFDHCEEFTAAFYEAAMKTEEFLLFARFAQIIERELQLSGTAASFKKSLVQILFTPFSPMGQQQMKTNKMIEKRVKFIGELYKIRWVDIDGLTIVFDMLSETEVLVQLFHALLNIVELTIAQSGHGEKLVKYRKLYLRRQDGYMDSTSDYLICLEVIEMLSEIATLCGKRFVFDAETVKTIIDDLNMKNIAEQAIKIETMSEGSKKDFELIVSAVLNKLAECDDDQLMSSLSSKLLEVFKDSKAQLKEKFVDKCLKLLISKFLRGEEAANSNAFSTIEFFGKLYSMNVVSANFIALCCEILFDPENENKITCLCILLSAIGAKFEADDCEALEKGFEGFEEFLSEARSDSCVAGNLRNLVELRVNGWKAAGTSQSPLQQAIVLLKNLTRSDLSSEAICSEIVKLAESSPKELVVSFYFAVVQNPNKAELYADVCEIIQKQVPEFSNHLNDYLQSSVQGLSCLQKHDYEEDSLNDLAAITIFIGELFAIDLIEDDAFVALLKPAKNLRFDSINQLSAIVGDKVSSTDNNQLKALLMTLEDAAQNDSNRFWEDLKKDINDRSFQ